jgi:hypothetical protein
VAKKKTGDRSPGAKKATKPTPRSSAKPKKGGKKRAVAVSRKRAPATPRRTRETTRSTVGPESEDRSSMDERAGSEPVDVGSDPATRAEFERQTEAIDGPHGDAANGEIFPEDLSDDPLVEPRAGKCFNCGKDCTEQSFCYGCKAIVCDDCEPGFSVAQATKGSHAPGDHLVDFEAEDGDDEADDGEA